MQLSNLLKLKVSGFSSEFVVQDDKSRRRNRSHRKWISTDTNDSSDPPNDNGSNGSGGDGGNGGGNGGGGGGGVVVVEVVVATAKAAAAAPRGLEYFYLTYRQVVTRPSIRRERREEILKRSTSVRERDEEKGTR
uniref:Uncharacterized protein n=2 Tax=Vespula TaxID=7451 RepID=A0A834K8L5_VESPE|nr:hypothetical protein H0235_015462 [Vespula pensylvanica]